MIQSKLPLSLVLLLGALFVISSCTDSEHQLKEDNIIDKQELTSSTFDNDVSAAISEGLISLNANDLKVLSARTTTLNFEEFLAKSDQSDETRCCCKYDAGKDCLPNVLSDACEMSGFDCVEDK